MKNKILLLACISSVFLNCKKEKKTEEIKTDTIVKVAIEKPNDSHNSQNSLDWLGIYKGITPCADCEGIETEISLNTDSTYVFKTKYLGKGDGKVFEEKGKFVWDEKGSSITLEGLKNRPSQYKVGENKLIQLDMQGQLITGKLAEKYVLKK